MAIEQIVHLHAQLSNVPGVTLLCLADGENTTAFERSVSDGQGLGRNHGNLLTYMTDCLDVIQAAESLAKFSLLSRLRFTKGRDMSINIIFVNDFWTTVNKAIGRTGVCHASCWRSQINSRVGLGIRFSGMSTDLQEYYTYCYDNVEDPNQPNYDFLKDTVKKCLPIGFDFNTPMPWELKAPEPAMAGTITQEGEIAEHEVKSK